MIVANREFIGEAWLCYLADSGLPFAIRVKKNEQIRHTNGGYMKLGQFFSNLQAGDK